MTGSLPALLPYLLQDGPSENAGCTVGDDDGHVPESDLAGLLDAPREADRAVDEVVIPNFPQGVDTVDASRVRPPREEAPAAAGGAVVAPCLNLIWQDWTPCESWQPRPPTAPGRMEAL